MKTYAANGFILIIGLILLLSSECVFGQKTYSIIELGDFTPTGINNSRQVSGYRFLNVSTLVAVRWQNGTITDYPTLSTNGAKATDINNLGEMSGIATDGNGFIHAVIFKNDTSINLLPSSITSQAYAINDAGHTVGMNKFCDTCSSNAALWMGGNPIDLGAFSEYGSIAKNLNNFGLIVGNSEMPPTYHERAFKTTGGGLIDLGTLGGESYARDVNNSGIIVGYSQDLSGNRRAVIWNPGITNIQTLTGTSSRAYAVNESDQVVGEIVTPSGYRGFVWENGVMQVLDSLIHHDSGWVIQRAIDINDLGDILAYGVKNNISSYVILISGLKITRPSFNEKWIAGEKDTIKWNGGKKNQFLQIDFSIDSGRTFTIIDFIPNADTGIYVWDVPKHILSKKCMIRIVDMADTTIADTSDIFKIKPYILTRDSSGQYEPYRPEEDQWGFWNYQPDMFPQVWYQQFFYQGLDPFTNSQYSQWQGWFTFATAKSSDFPDWASWVNTFGVNACYVSTILGMYSPTAIQRWSAVKHPWGGSCFGISASNALAFSYKGQFQTKYSSFPAFVNPITVLSNEGVKTVVNELFTHQFGDPSRKFGNGRWDVITPNQTLIELKAMFKEDNVSPRTLSIYNNNGPGGHSILPYKLERDVIVEYLFHLYVYDNAYPNSLAIIKIDTLGNSNNGIWTTLYGLANWGGEKYLMLEIESIDYFNNATFPKKAAGYSSPFILSSDELKIYTNIDANTKIIDNQGNVTGFNNGIIQEEIPNAIPLIYLDGSETPPYGYSLPTNNYSVIINEFTADTVKTFFFTGNKSFSYRRDGAAQNQTDRFFFDGGVSVSNPDQQNKTISLLNIINETTQEKLFGLSSIELAQNDSVKIENPDSNKIKLTSFGTAKDYDIELNYVNENGIGRFGDFDVPLEANTSHTFVPDWSDVTNTDLMVLVDNGNNGTIDDTLYLENQVTGIGDDQGSLLTPTNYNLAQNYPNPFNPVTTIQYSLTQRSNVTLKVYDVLGKEIAVLVNEEKDRGVYNVNFDATGLASGMYMYRIQAGSFAETKKMILLR